MIIIVILVQVVSAVQLNCTFQTSDYIYNICMYKIQIFKYRYVDFKSPLKEEQKSTDVRKDCGNGE